jgi:hypothetical protein
LEVLEDRIAPAAHIGNQTFATIQAAVNAANTGAVITVDPGVYHESIVVNKSVTIEGAQAGVAGQAASRTGNPATESVVDNATTGTPGTTAFDVTASNVTIEGFTIEGSAKQSDGGFGVFLGNNISGTHLLDNIIENNIIGLGLANAGASEAVIQDNLFLSNNNPGTASGTAIFSNQTIAGGALNNVLIDRNVFVNNLNAGIELSSTDPTQGASGITITNNTFSSNAQDIYLSNTTNATITGNSILNTLSPASNGSGSAALGLYGNDSNVTITNNLLQNGTAFGIRIGNFNNTGPNSNIALNNNSISGFAAAALRLDPGGFSGTLNATGNYWGAATGPTSPNNSGGTGAVIDDAGHQVTFAPWLSSGANGTASAQAGFSGNSASLISSNSPPSSSDPPPSPSSVAPATLSSIFQLLITDLTLAQSFQSNGLDQIQQQFGMWIFLASQQSSSDAINLVFDEISLTTGAITVVEGALLGRPDSAMLDTLGQIEASISNNPLAATTTGQVLMTLTGPLIMAGLLQ